MRVFRTFIYCLSAVLLSSCAASYDESTSYRAPYEIGGEARNSERFAWFIPNKIETTATRPVSAFSVDVDTMGYVIARRYILDRTLPPLRSVKSAEFLNYFDYGYDAPKLGDTPFKITSVVSPNPWNPDTKLLHIGIKSYDIPVRALPPLHVVLAIDTSEQMGAPDRLPLIQAAADKVIALLGERDQVAIVSFGNEALVALPPTAASDRLPIKAAIAKLAPQGKSKGFDGVDLAYQTAVKMHDQNATNLVVVISGGEFQDIHEKNKWDFQLYSKVTAHRNLGIGIRVLGVGSKTLNADVLQHLATAGRSKATYADSEEEALRFFATELGSRRVVVAHEVLANVEFNPAQVAEYRLIGYEASQSSSSDARGATYPGADIGAGQEATILYEITSPDSPSRRVQPLRYTKSTVTAPDPRYGDEVAFVRIGYRLPGKTRRQFIAQAITPRDERSDFASVAPEARFAIAVAAYAEKLRNDGYVGDEFTFKQVHALASDAIPADPFDQRHEFLDLVARASVLACAASPQISADCR